MITRAECIDILSSHASELRSRSSPHSSFLQKTNRARWNRYLYVAIEYFIKNIYTIVPFEKE